MYFLNTFSRSELFSNSEKNIFSSSFQKSHRHIKSNKLCYVEKHQKNPIKRTRCATTDRQMLLRILRYLSPK